MKTIQAKVNPRLLSKADRLFTGTLDGRIIEILQNARRAGTTEVHIISSVGQVAVTDNGRGIADFAARLDLGKSGWDESLESVEDPAGVGVFCLAPREVTITSGNQQVVIKDQGWTGEPVEVVTTETEVKGTMLAFADEPWAIEFVQKHAVFTGLKVFVDGQVCDSQPFVSEQAVSHPELGCRIEVRDVKALGQWHHAWKPHYYTGNVLVNFHGQVVVFTYEPVNEERLQFLIDLTGEPTGIRLMLPARTQLVANAALEALKATLEKEAFRYIQRRGSHKLRFSDYCRAQELGIELPEAEPVFRVGLLGGESPEPVAVVKPKDFPLAKCYRMDQRDNDADELDDANAHLLSARGQFEQPFVVVEISSYYDGYSWARLPTVERIEVKAGREIRSQYLWCERLIAVESLQITAHISDGQTFTSEVPLAVNEPPHHEGTCRWVGTDVLVTRAAQRELEPTDIWYHLGGWSEDGDTYDTQLADFEEQLNHFWATIVGPGEYLRLRLLECLNGFDLDWQSVSIEASGKVWITHQDGRAEMLLPPEFSASS